jgi:hypothetical protein
MISTRLCVGLALVSLSLAACHSSGPLHVVVDPTLQAGDVYEVSGLVNRHWGKPVSFGGFATRETRAGETWAWSAGSFDLGVGKRHQPYRFVFVGEEGAQWQVECRAKTPILRHAGKHSEWELPIGETELGCAMRDENEVVHALSVNGNGADFAGVTDFGDEPFEIQALHELPRRDGRSVHIPGVLGWELRQEGRVLASVDLLGAGRVYLSREATAEQRDRLAMTATALMLFGER